MALQLIENWERINDLSNRVENRNSVLIAINKKYYDLINYEHFFNVTTNQLIASEFEAMNYETIAPDLGDFSFGFQLSDKFMSWVAYNVDFFNVNEDILSLINSEIVISSANAENFSFIKRADDQFESYNTNFLLYEKGGAWSRITDSHYLLSKSLSIKPPSSVQFFRYPLPTLYTKLIINIIK